MAGGRRRGRPRKTTGTSTEMQREEQGQQSTPQSLVEYEVNEEITTVAQDSTSSQTVTNGDLEIKEDEIDTTIEPTSNLHLHPHAKEKMEANPEDNMEHQETASKTWRSLFSGNRLAENGQTETQPHLFEEDRSTSSLFPRYRNTSSLPTKSQQSINSSWSEIAASLFRTNRQDWGVS